MSEGQKSLKIAGAKRCRNPKEVDTQGSKREKGREKKNTVATGKKGRGCRERDERAQKRSDPNGLLEGRKSLEKAKAKTSPGRKKRKESAGREKKRGGKKFESAYWPVSQEPGNQFRRDFGGVPEEEGWEKEGKS